MHIHTYIYIHGVYVFTLFQVHSICPSFLSKTASKEIQLLLFDSWFMLTWCDRPPKETNTRNLQCDLVIFSRYYCWAPSIFSMEHFCINTTYGHLICLKIILKNRLLDSSLLKQFNQK